jgi:hypothetical protein
MQRFDRYCEMDFQYGACPPLAAAFAEARVAGEFRRVPVLYPLPKGNGAAGRFLVADALPEFVEYFLTFRRVEIHVAKVKQPEARLRFRVVMAGDERLVQDRGAGFGQLGGVSIRKVFVRRQRQGFRQRQRHGRP